MVVITTIGRMCFVRRTESERQGVEMYFSDVYSHCRTPVQLRNDFVLCGECISSALYWNDFISLAKKCGFSDPRVVYVDLSSSKKTW